MLMSAGTIRTSTAHACIRNCVKQSTAQSVVVAMNGVSTMRKRDTRPRPLPKTMRRMAKINQLRAEGTIDARKERKHMNDRWYGRHVSIDVKGFYSKRGKHPMRGTYTKASRGLAIARKSWL